MNKLRISELVIQFGQLNRSERIEIFQEPITHLDLVDLTSEELETLRRRLDLVPREEAKPTASGPLGLTITRQPAYLAPGELSSVSYSVQRLGLAPGRLALLVAEGFTGKTTLAQYFGICVAHGKPIFGQFSVNTGKVLHIDQEQDEQQTRDRNHLLAAGLGVTGTPELYRARFACKFDDPSFDRGAVKAALVEACKGYSFVIVDSLKKITCAEENNAEVSEVVHLLKEVAEDANTCIMLVHHKGKTKSEARQSGRGHSSIYDSVDCQWDLSNATDGQFELKNTKNRSRMSKLLPGLIYTITNPGEFIPEKDCTTGGIVFQLLQDSITPTQIEHGVKQTILKLVKDNPRITATAIRHQVGGDNNLTSMMMKELSSDDLLKIENGKGSAKHYVITAEGESYLSYEATP